MSFSPRGVADVPDACGSASPELLSLTGLSRFYKKKDCEALIYKIADMWLGSMTKLKSDKGEN
jgi:hypothetical protein